MLGVSSGIPLRRALFPIDPRTGATDTVDVLVIGTGVAGLTVATSLPAGLSVAVATKGRLQDGSTWSAQGGVAASFGNDDAPGLHLADTLEAGCGLCDADAVRTLVEDATDSIRFLERSGLSLDVDARGRSLAREGGHSRNRIVHAGGDATGAAIIRALAGSAARMGVKTVEESFCADLLHDESGAIAGAVFLTPFGVRVVRCGAVVLASGGYGQLFAETTSPVTCTGDGAAAALRAGAALADLEFVQFHPTTLHVERDPRPLLSEAMRGEGAVLRDGAGAPVMTGVHPLGDLAPRDIVSRAMVDRMTTNKSDHLFLDATGLDQRHLEHRFPTIVASCRSFGVDPVAEWIPVSPAAHYTMGGIQTDLDGRTDVGGLFAVGEVASTGVHGANRLASNSLLEGVVFGRRVAAVIGGLPVRGNLPVPLEVSDYGGRARVDGDRRWLRRTMVNRAGVVRSGDGLRSLLDDVAERLDRLPRSSV
ncbi:MAG TPA: L-aspartate oxidase, partial [Acidimicrobiales bacterium]|nr:L-aspartate oxidase [Acidimicrobiales bacterium]